MYFQFSELKQTQKICERNVFFVTVTKFIKELLRLRIY